MNQQAGIDVPVQPNFLGTTSNAGSYYRILNVDPQATKLAIREAYLRLKSMYQSNNDGLYGLTDAGEIQRQLHELEEAFSVLNDDFKRANYDRRIGSIAQANLEGHEGPNVSQPGVIQTNRSTLRVIKTRALKAEDPNHQELIESVLVDSDLGDGTVLAKLRQALDVSEAEMQERTKISLEYIRSMESNRFDRLPQVVYVKGFMRSYLRYLCVPNPEEIIKAFAARLEAWQQGPKQ